VSSAVEARRNPTARSSCSAGVGQAPSPSPTATPSPSATDDINMQRDCFVRLADVLAAAGRAQGAEAALHEALAPYERKSNVVTG